MWISQRASRTGRLGAPSHLGGWRQWKRNWSITGVARARKQTRHQAPSISASAQCISNFAGTMKTESRSSRLNAAAPKSISSPQPDRASCWRTALRHDLQTRLISSEPQAFNRREGVRVHSSLLDSLIVGNQDALSCLCCGARRVRCFCRAGFCPGVSGTAEGRTNAGAGPTHSRGGAVAVAGLPPATAPSLPEGRAKVATSIST